MYEFISKVTARGQITLPQKLREEEGITENDYVIIKKFGKYILISKAELEIDDIAKAFRAEAKRRGITKKDLMSALKKAEKKIYE